MKIQVTVDGSTEEVDVDVDGLTLQESCDVYDALGADEFDRYSQGRVSPPVIRAIVWAKLRRRFPNLDLRDFDLDMTSSVEAAGEEDPGPFESQS